MTYGKNSMKGKFIPENPEKYIGDVNNIVLRSSYEYKFANWADNNPSVIKWFSEEICIPYYSALDNKMHRYFPDFGMVIKNKDGKEMKYLVEIKPYSMTQPPNSGKKSQKTLIEEVFRWETNKAKWDAARDYCKKNNMNFQIITEKELRI